MADGSVVAFSGWLMLVIGAWGSLLSLNALWPRYSRAALAAVSFFAGWLRAELALHGLILEAALFGVLTWGGALLTWPGRIGAVLACVSMALLILSLRQSLSSRAAIEEALVEFVHEDSASEHFRWRSLIVPAPVQPAGVERLRDVVYHVDGDARLRLDVYRRRGDDYGPTAKHPALVYVHGGAWMIGNKAQQGRPLLHHLAARGWICFSIEYRLSPGATFPDHLVDVKRAIAWVRAHAVEQGVDPRFIAVAGNSAGGHLASLAALTARDRTMQPGFEDADTSVCACLAFYGVYDLGNRHGHWPHRGLQAVLERFVMKARLNDAPDRFEAASPIAHIGPEAPPFLVVHGDRDSLIPVAEARMFVNALRHASTAPCVYIELPGAQHAFDVFPSVRTLNLMHGLEVFVMRLHRDYLAAVGASPA
jgi:acetyl esterase/lipase